MQGSLTVQAIDQPRESATAHATRLHYLDWLRVLAIVGVFLFHAVHPFDLTDWHIKNSELSMGITLFLVFFSLWGMPFFFLISGTGAWFALRRRTSRQYVVERTQRLLIPFIVGAILLMPIMLYFEWQHNVLKGVLHSSFAEHLLSRTPPLSPDFFGWAGYHLWFLGFLFCFSLITLPFFRWLQGASGQKLLAWLAQCCTSRGGILLFILPLLAIQMVFRPLFPAEHDWADFFVQMTYFAFGYILIADKRFTEAITRDWRLFLTAAVVAFALVLATFVWGDPFVWIERPDLLWYYLAWTLVTVNGWCWTVAVLALGMRTLNFTNAWLRYGQEAVLPIFVLHQPVIIVIAFYVVQWQAGIPLKLVTVVVSSFVVCIAIYDLLIKRVDILRVLFGNKPRRLAATT